MVGVVLEGGVDWDDFDGGYDFMMLWMIMTISFLVFLEGKVVEL